MIPTWQGQPNSPAPTVFLGLGSEATQAPAKRHVHMRVHLRGNIQLAVGKVFLSVCLSNAQRPQRTASRVFARCQCQSLVTQLQRQISVLLGWEAPVKQCTGKPSSRGQEGSSHSHAFKDTHDSCSTAGREDNTKTARAGQWCFEGADFRRAKIPAVEEQAVSPSGTALEVMVPTEESHLEVRCHKFDCK